ncbi:peptidyl-prolyl cis-trans isomerase [Flavobacteriaceae bacterium]|jgi:peptidylprolyl isomerase|nr:peptidyl-prolyl cis-trans isomerase [Flavobacteriaceae bacterium]
MFKIPKYIVIFLSYFSICFFGCQQQEKTVIKTVPVVKKKTVKKDIETILQKRTDSINKTNVIPFLKAYGNLNKESIVLFKTRLGNIKIELYKETPLHRASFIFLTKTGYFNTTAFHRIVPDFIVQGGNSDLPMTRKLRIRYNYRIPAEIKSHRKHKYGALAAARQWENNPNKTSSPFEFYMIQDKRGSHHLDGEHTIFGEIIEGFDTMEKIAKLETDKKEWPLKEVFIKALVLK